MQNGISKYYKFVVVILIRTSECGNNLFSITLVDVIHIRLCGFIDTDSEANGKIKTLTRAKLLLTRAFLHCYLAIIILKNENHGKQPY